MRSSPRKSILILAFTVTGLLVISLACNLPLLINEPGITTGELQATLQALEETWPTEFVIPDAEDRQSGEPLSSGLATATSSGGNELDSAEENDSSSIEITAPAGMITYVAQSGDVPKALASRFGVDPGEILTSSLDPLAEETQDRYLTPGQILFIPDNLNRTLSSAAVLPDSEIIYSPSTIGFSLEEAANHFQGFLSTYQEEVNGELLSGAEVIQRVADLTSTNPLFLLAFLEFRAGWVRGDPQAVYNTRQPIGFNIPDQQGLYREMSIVANQLNRGYYNWREGSLTSLKFPDETTARLAPALNAGTIAVQRLFSFFYKPGEWEDALYGSSQGISNRVGFTQLYEDLLGDPWERAAVVEPLLPAGLVQPDLELPFLPGNRWALTGGPHYSWNAGSPRGALDFSPITGKSGCYVSPIWATATASGVITRDGEGILMLDLDGDGFEQTGWVLLYLHLAKSNRVPVGTRVERDDPLGQPSCEGGISSGTHLHLARKYNGEWLAADGPIPFVLDGWQAFAGERNYAGGLQRDGQQVSANPGGNSSTVIQR